MTHGIPFNFEEFPLLSSLQVKIKPYNGKCFLPEKSKDLLFRTQVKFDFTQKHFRFMIFWELDRFRPRGWYFEN